ncbi:MAG: FAD-dependent oxidoreductase [Lentisphaeria bacterium]|nr:FAD-dependent oxidoreductase [Lentisphaeria bacterium]
MKNINISADFVVVGGGLSGLCAAVAAAREGIKTVLIHDRPVLGGNASSEIRMWVCGAHGDNMRETGIIEEILLENIYRNPERNFSLWDTVLYSTATREKNLTILLNAVCMDATMDGAAIKKVKAYQSVSQTFYTVEGKYFCDSSGDSILASLSGAEIRYGREARNEFNESIAPIESDKKTMGMSCLLQARETDEVHEFIAPEWANHYTDASQFKYREPDLEGLQNYWWIELGGDMDALHDVDICRHELLKIALGTWDYLKNHPTQKEKNKYWELEWIGFLPGKRESNRYVGDYIVTQNDVASGGKFEDTIAYGGWTMDDHAPTGFKVPEIAPNIFHPAPSPFGLPYRAIYSKNIENLFCAGRNISVTHSALSATRVMATCAILGQAAGIAASMAVAENLLPRQVDVKKLQNRLMELDCYLPRFRYIPSDLIMAGTLTADNGKSPEGLRMGQNRITDEADEAWYARVGNQVEYSWSSPIKLSQSRLIFDSDLADFQPKNIVALRFKNHPQLEMPKSLVKKYRLDYCDKDGNWQSLGEFDNLYKRLVFNNFDIECTKIRFTLLETFGDEEVKIFAWTVK